MSPSEKLCLQWKDFQTNISESYKYLRAEEEFADITLSCEDNQKLEVHKVIIASASKVFKDILMGNKHNHPLIYMRGIKAKDMTALVDFIYNGEVNVDQKDLDRFLEIGEELQLKGLLKSREIMDGHSVPNDLIVKRKEKPPNTAKPVNLVAEQYLLSGNQIDNLQAKKEFIPENYTIDLVEDSQGFEANTPVPLKADDNEELDEKINSIIQRADGIWRCTVCGKGDKLSNSIKKHAEIHIEQVGRPCGYCDKMFKSRNSLQVHISKTHSVKYF